MAAGISKSFSGTAGKYVSGYGQFDLYIQFSMAETYDTATRKSDLLFSNFQIRAVDPQANTTSYVGGSITVTVNGTAYTIFSAAASAGTYKVTANGSYNTVLVNSSGEAWSYSLSGLSRGNDGKLSVEVSWNGITLNNWYSGFGISVNCEYPERMINLFENLLSDRWQKILQWGIEGDWVGIGHCILGYPAADPKPAAPRKPDYIVKV